MCLDSITEWKEVLRVYHLYEMSRIGKLGSYDVIVCTDDSGMIPHFHILSKDRKDFDCCIRIDKSEYFSHGTHTDTLNSRTRKDLVDFLNSKHKRGMTNWVYLLQMWNDNNSAVEIPEDLPIPDYRNIRLPKLKDSIIESIM